MIGEGKGKRVTIEGLKNGSWAYGRVSLSLNGLVGVFQNYDSGRLVAK